MSQPSILLRVTAVLCIVAIAYAALIAQDISGGAGVLLASADVEAKLGKGIFTPAQKRKHEKKELEKRVFTREERRAHRTSASSRVNTNTNTATIADSQRRPNRNTNDLSQSPLGGPARRVGDDAETYLKQGDDYFDKKDYPKAAEAYEQAIRRRPTDADAHVNLAEAYFNQGRYEDAIAAAQKAIQLGGNTSAAAADAYRVLGTAYLKTSRSSEALEALNKAFELDANDPETRNGLALIYYDQGVAAYNGQNYEEATRVYVKAIDLNPRYFEAANNLGDSYLKLNKLEDAAKAYERAVSIRPVVDTYVSLAEVYDDLGRYVDAGRTYDRMLPLKPDGGDAEFNNNRGYALGKSKRWSEAIVAFKRAIELKPDYAEAHSNLGWAYNNLANFQAALEPLKKAIQLKPDLPEGHFNIGITYTRLNQKKEALAEFQKTIQLRPNWPAAQNNLGHAYGNLGRWKQAIAAHKEAIRLKPDYGGAHFNLGVDYLMNGDRRDAEAQYRALKPLNVGLANQLYVMIFKKAPPADNK